MGRRMQDEELEPGQGAEPSVASISRQVPQCSRSREGVMSAEPAT